MLNFAQASQVPQTLGVGRARIITVDLAMSNDNTKQDEAASTSLPNGINFKKFIEEDVIAKLPPGELYSPKRIKLSIPDSLILQSTLGDDVKDSMEQVLREPILNALQAQREGEIEIFYKDNTVFIRNDGDIYDGIEKNTVNFLKNINYMFLIILMGQSMILSMKTYYQNQKKRRGSLIVKRLQKKSTNYLRPRKVGALCSFLADIFHLVKIKRTMEGLDY